MSFYLTPHDIPWLAVAQQKASGCKTVSYLRAKLCLVSMKTPKAPHVVILPFPAQGHVKPMLNLAMLLSHSGMHITFATSKAVLDALVNQIDSASFLATFPSFQFKPLSDGYPTKFTANNFDSILVEAFDITTRVTPLRFHDLLASLCVDDQDSSSPTCVIADGIMSFGIEWLLSLGFQRLLSGLTVPLALGFIFIFRS